MKRIVALLLAYVLIFSCGIYAFAEDTYISETGANSAQTVVEFYYPSQYTVLIPDRIWADDYGYAFYAPVVNLLDGEQVNVYFEYPDVNENNCPVLFLYDDRGRKTECTFETQFINNCAAYFTNDHQENDNERLIARVNTYNLAAGTYTGTITFRVRLVQFGEF